MTNKGYTLVEMVIYLALLALFLGVIVMVLLGVGQSLTYVQTTLDIQKSAITSVDRIIREVQQATSIDSGNSVFNTSPGTLSLTTKDDSGNTVTRTIYLDDGRVHMKENGIDMGALTTSDVTVTALTFQYINVVASKAVKVEMTIQGGTGANALSENFYTTAVVRSSISG